MLRRYKHSCKNKLSCNQRHQTKISFIHTSVNNMGDYFVYNENKKIKEKYKQISKPKIKCILF